MYRKSSWSMNTQNVRKHKMLNPSSVLKQINISKLVSRCTCRNELRCKILVVGGGAGGCSVAWRLYKNLSEKDIILIEPSAVHYYQPLFALIGAGIKKFSQSHRQLQAILPPGVMWLKDQVDEFDPCNNAVFTQCGLRVRYDALVIAVGLKNDYDKIPGLSRTLNDPLAQVSTIYSPQFCTKCWCNIQRFRGGHAIFTFPKEVGKCSGAAQKIMYLAHDYWTQKKIIQNSSITYITPKEALFGITKYAKALSQVAESRDIAVNYKLELKEVTSKNAVFTENSGHTVILPYNFLHVTPPMSPPTCLTNCTELASEGFLDVDKHTLQHTRYFNVFGIGDCINTPNSKTAAAVACQSNVVAKNLWSTIYGKPLVAKYNGYGACAILTSYKRGIIAEFTYDGKIAETLPFDQAKERRICFYLQNNVFPYLYWHRLLKGKWNGPGTIRKIINPFAKETKKI